MVIKSNIKNFIRNLSRLICQIILNINFIVRIILCGRICIISSNSIKDNNRIRKQTVLVFV